MSALVPVVVIGLGGIGFRYDADSNVDEYVHTHVHAFRIHPRFELLAGVDSNPAARAAFTAATGLPGEVDFDAACVHLPLGARPLVVVATPTHTHLAQVRGVLNRVQPSALLCEKPIAATVADGREIFDICQGAAVPLFVNYFRRSLPGVIEVAQRLGDGRIAPGSKIVSWYTKGFLHNGSHFWNLLEYWFGSVHEAEPIGLARVGPWGLEFDCRVRFASAEAFLIHAWEEQYSLFDLDLVAPNGRLSFKGEGGMAWRAKAPNLDLPGYYGLAREPEQMRFGIERYQWHVADQLARYLDGSKAHLCTGEQALQTIESMSAALASAKEL